jgi:hypothetical protein
MSPRSPHLVLSFLTAGFLGVTGLHAQQQDAPPVNVSELLRALQTLAPKQAAQSQAAKQSAAQTILGQANSADGGVAFWESAIKGTQMEGASQGNNEFRVWKETDGEVYKDKQVQSAIHLHLEWLAITLQRSAGATVKDLLPAIQNYVRELWADQVMMIMLEESVKKEKESVPQVPGGRGPGRNSAVAKALGDDRKIREVHDQVLNRNIANGLIANWMHLHDYANGIDSWENVPGNIDGIYTNIIQPELRVQKDPRVFEYWDTRMKVDSDTATRTKLTFEIDKYNTLTAPNLLFNRAQEYIALGQKNRAATEMYGIIQKYPNHPKAGEWITALQGLLAPPAPDTTASAAPAAVSAAAAVSAIPAARIAPAPTAVVPPPAPTVPPSPGVSASTLALPGASAPPAPAPGALPGQ